MTAHLRAPLSEQAVVDAAREASIGLYGLAPFHAHAQPRPGLMFGYGSIAVEHIDAALTTLAGILPRIAR
jgi:GntR family transcriptional regulator/MocR family aminotransferase